MRCKNCGRDLEFGINPDQFLIALFDGTESSIRMSYYHRTKYDMKANYIEYCSSPVPDYKFKDYIKRCKRNARSVKSQ